MSTDTNPNSPRFQNNQRVRILPCKNNPPTAAPGGVRYGIVFHGTQHPGMHLLNEDRVNDSGEWAYCVGSWQAPKAGAMWFSAAGLEPMKRDGSGRPIDHAGRFAKFDPCI